MTDLTFTRNIKRSDPQACDTVIEHLPTPCSCSRHQTPWKLSAHVNTCTVQYLHSLTRTIAMSTPAFALSIIEVVYFSLMLLPVLYLTATYRKPFTLGWPLLATFLVLQITGAALVLRNGKDGPPSITGTIISGVGLSPQLLGTVGILHQCAHSSGTLNDSQTRKHVEIASAIFHVAVVTAIPIYAVGQSGRSRIPPNENAASLSKAGIVLLLFLWLLSAIISVWYSLRKLCGHQERASRYRGIFMAVMCSMGLLGIRILYQTVATLTDDPKYSAIGGSIAYVGCLQFLPSALVILVLVLGGFHSLKAHKGANSRAETEC